MCITYWLKYYTLHLMEYKHNPPTLAELRQATKPVKNPRLGRYAHLTFSEKFAVFLHRQVGSLKFFFLIFFWTIGWLGWNIWAPAEYRFDPAPAFVIWLFASNILQLILLPVIMVGQNIEDRATEKRAELDFEVNRKAEEEIETIIAHLENQDEMLLQLMRKIDQK